MLNLNKIILEDLERIASEQVQWEKLRGATVLITGAAGMIASYLTYLLLYLNETKNMKIQVLALVRNKEKAEKHFAGLLNREDLKLVVQDVCEPLDYEDKIDFIIHAASQVSPAQFIQDPAGTISANTTGTLTMLNLAKQKKAKGFLYLSTREIYGKAPDSKEYVSETDYGAIDPTLLRSCYPESKRISETLCAAYKYQFNLNCKIARIAHSYGPGITIGDGRVLGDFLKNVINGENIVMNSEGNAVLGLTYISDLIRGLFLVLLNFDEMVYNISNQDATVTVRELALKLASMYPDKKIGVSFINASASQQSGYLSHRVGLLDSTKANESGWIPEVGIDEGMRRTVTYFETVCE